MCTPSRAGDSAFRDWWSSYLRMGASPAAAVALTRMNAQIDIRHILPTVRVPTLVVHRTGDRCAHQHDTGEEAPRRLQSDAHHPELVGEVEEPGEEPSRYAEDGIASRSRACIHL